MSNQSFNSLSVFLFWIMTLPISHALSLTEAITKVMEKEGSLETEKGNVQAEEAEELGNIFDFFPNLTASGIYNYYSNPLETTISASSLGAGTPANDFNLILTGRNVVTSRIDAILPVFHGGEQLASLHFTRAKKNLELARLKSKELELRTSVVKLYIQLNQCQFSLPLLQQSIQYFQNYQEKINVLFKNSSALLLDMKQANAKLAAAKSELSIAKVQCHHFERQFEALVGEPIGSIQVLPKKIIHEITQDEWLKKAVHQNPMIQMSTHQEEMANHLVSKARAQFFPKIDLSGSYLSQYSDLTPNIHSWGVGITARFPLFDWHHTFTQVKKASIEHNNYEQSLTDAKINLKNEIQNKLDSIHATQELAESIESEFEYSQEKLKNFSAKKSLSIETDLNLLEQKITQMKLKLKLEQSWNDYSIQLAHLYALTGEIPELAFQP